MVRGRSVTVVVAAEGYPGRPGAGDVVEIGDLPEGVTVQHAGTKARGHEVVTSGGRVLR